ncbi:hypothetical protein M8C21_011805, partial [Ambrosia artemisiifolia]
SSHKSSPVAFISFATGRSKPWYGFSKEINEHGHGLTTLS